MWTVCLQLRIALIPLLMVTLCGGTLEASDKKPGSEDSAGDPGLSQAEYAISKGDYGSALTALRGIVQKDANNHRAWLNLGEAYEGLGDQDQAINAYQRSVNAKPDVFQSNYKLGLILANQGKPGAEEALRAAIRLASPEQGHEAARAWIALGRLLLASNPTEALGAFQKADVLEPNNSASHAGVGQILEKQAKFDDAEVEYKQALAVDPGCADALIGLTDIYLKESRLNEAEGFLRVLLDDRPTDAMARSQLGRVLAVSKKTDEAIAQYEAATRLAPNDSSAEKRLASLYLRTGRYAEAEDVYRGLVQSYPRDAHLRRSLAEDLFSQKRYEEAESEFAAALQLKPDWGDVYGELAVAAHQNQHYPVAIRALDNRAKYLVEIPISYYLRASAYDHIRDRKNALLNYRLFLQAAAGRYPDLEAEVQDRLTSLGSDGK